MSDFLLIPGLWVEGLSWDLAIYKYENSPEISDASCICFLCHLSMKCTPDRLSFSLTIWPFFFFFFVLYLIYITFPNVEIHVEVAQSVECINYTVSSAKGVVTDCSSAILSLGIL